jgi:hypothetical protein
MVGFRRASCGEPWYSNTGVMPRLGIRGPENGTYSFVRSIKLFSSVFVHYEGNADKFKTIAGGNTSRSF